MKPRLQRLAWALALLALGASAFAQTQAQAQAQGGASPGNCAVCHGKENREFQSSVHAKGGVTCIDCHGGSPGSLDVAGAHGDRLLSLRDPRAAVESCGTCHADVQRMRAFGLRTDQLSLYWTSRHGQKLQQDGDPQVATCTSCHGAHAVRAVIDPLSPVNRFKQVETCGHCHADPKLMGAYGISADVVGQYQGSVHGKALLEQGRSSAPACTDCHGSHGAAPPRFDDLRQVCGHCHSTVQTFFAESSHARSAGARTSVQCISCHSNHAVVAPSTAMFLGDDPGHCGACHADAQDPALAIGRVLHDDLQQLAATIASAEDAVRLAAGRGLFLGDERGYIDQARGLLVRSRAMTHALSPEALDDILHRGQGMVGQTLESLATKNRVFRDRQIFTSIFLGLSLVFAIVLWMYGLEVRGRRRHDTRAAPGEKG